GIYFSDPRYGREDDLEQDGFHVYYLSPQAKELRRVIDDLKKPNGVVGSSDGKTLYVADPGDNKTYRYRIASDGSLSDRQLAAPEGSDGLALDERGNLYLTRRAVLVYSPQGEKVGEIAVPESPANLTFGGTEGKTLFITAR